MTALFTALMILTCIALAGAEQLRWRVNLTVDSIEGKVPGISIGDQFVAGFEVESSLFDLPDGLQDGRFVNFDLIIGEINWNESQPHSSPQFLLSPSGIDAFSVILTTTLPAHPDLSFFLPESPARWEVKDENDLTGKPIFGGDFGGTYTVKPILAVSKKNYIPPEPEIVAELDGLNIYISELPDTELNRGLRKSLSQKLNAAKNAYVRGNPCTAVNILDAYLNHTSALIKGKAAQVAEDLRNRGWMLRNNLLLNLPEGEKCKGFENLDQAPEVRIKTSDNQHFAASVSFGLPVLGSVKAGGETWTQLTIPALQSHVGEPGMPAIPTWHVLVAVPRGAQIKLKVATPQVRSEILANLYPFQEQAVDGVTIDQDFEFVDPPFVKNQDLYETDAFYPAEPCSVEIVGNIRDLTVAQLTCVGGRYNPVTKTLQLHGDFDFELLFEGGDGTFITDRSLSPFETATKSNLDVVINRTAVQQYIEPCRHL